MWKKIGMVSAAVLLLGVGIVTLTAFSGGGFCHHGHRDPAQMAAFVTNRVEDALDDLDATPDQRTRILAVTDRMLDAAKQVHAVQGATHEAVDYSVRSDCNARRSPNREQRMRAIFRGARCCSAQYADTRRNV